MLTARQRILASILDSLGGADLKEFSDRLLLQKRVFMLTMAGVDLGYSYSWYLRGPYCPALTFDAFALDGIRKASGEIPSEPAPAVVRNRVQELRSALGEAWSNPSELELLSSVLFIATSTRDQTEEGLWERLLVLKPNRFGRDAFKKSLSKLKSAGYLDADYQKG